MSDTLKDFAAGTMGGFTAKLLDYPLDTVKVLLQTQAVNGSAKANPQSTAPLYRGAWHCLQHTFQSKGILGLYKGLSSPLLGCMVENAVLFVSYSSFKSALAGHGGHHHDLTLLELALAGGAAGGVVSFAVTPFELVKCRLQVMNSSSSGFRLYRGPMDVVKQTLQTEGLVQGLYRGHFGTILREVPGNFCWYGTYEAVCMALIPEGGNRGDLGPMAHIAGGALAGVAYWSAFYPADTIKSQIQTHPEHSRHGFYETMMQILRSQGLKGLYGGWGVTVCRAAPSHAVIFATYEQCIKWLQPSHLNPPHGA